jgi:hypothetical protein
MKFGITTNKHPRPRLSKEEKEPKPNSRAGYLPPGFTLVEGPIDTSKDEWVFVKTARRFISKDEWSTPK